MQPSPSFPGSLLPGSSGTLSAASLALAGCCCRDSYISFFCRAVNSPNFIVSYQIFSSVPLPHYSNAFPWFLTISDNFYQFYAKIQRAHAQNISVMSVEWSACVQQGCRGFRRSFAHAHDVTFADVTSCDASNPENFSPPNFYMLKVHSSAFVTLCIWLQSKALYWVLLVWPPTYF